MSLKFKRFAAVLRARNKEFVRDKASLSWNIVMPMLLIAGLAFAFSNEDQALFTVGYVGQTSADSEFFDTRHIEFVAMDDLDSAMIKVERHQIDLLLDTRGQRFWINDSSPKGYILERLLQSNGIEGPYEKGTVSGDAVRYVDWLLPGILGMNMMFSALFGVGYVIVRYRKNGMLKRLKATPLTAFEFLTAQVISRLWLILFVSAIVYIGTDIFLDFTMNGSYLNLLLVFTLGSMCMISLALLSASRIASEELAGGILNLLTWPMMFLSGVWFSLEGSPEILRNFAQMLPLTHVIDATRAIMIDGHGLIQVGHHLIILAVLTVVFLLLGSRFFRWE
ncbi:MAG: ABC transporter permease [Gammaproteobacteria bacterium]|nr:ABC transporter permease [Gammaproteobacteria bacterium]